jgi:hypothetical protein
LGDPGGEAAEILTRGYLGSENNRLVKGYKTESLEKTAAVVAIHDCLNSFRYLNTRRRNKVLCDKKKQQASLKL